MKKGVIAVLLAALCITGCKQNKDIAKDEIIEESIVENLVADSTATDTKEVHWYDGIDWTQYPKKDTELLFSSAKVKAPLTLEKLIPLFDDFDMTGHDADGNSVELKPSDLTGDYVARTGNVYIDNCFFDLELYNEEDKPLRDMQDCFSLTTDYSMTFSLFGIDTEVPEELRYEDGKLSIFRLQEVAKKYGRPSYVVLTKGHENAWIYVYWQKEGYRFGYFLFDFSEDEPEPLLKGLLFYTDKAWEKYAASEDFIGQDMYVMPFDEYIGDSTVNVTDIEESVSEESVSEESVADVPVSDTEKEQADQNYDFLHYKDEHIRAEYDKYDKSYQVVEILDNTAESFKIPSYINDIPVTVVSLKTNISNPSNLPSLTTPATVKELNSVGNNPSLGSVILADGCQLESVSGDLYKDCDEIVAENGNDKIRVSSVEYPSAKELWDSIRLPLSAVSNTAYEGEPFAVYFGEYEELPEQEDLFYYNDTFDEYPEVETYKKNCVFYVPSSQTDLKNMLESYGMTVKNIE